MKKIWGGFLSIILSLLFIIIVGEMTTRAYLHFIYGSRITVLDDFLGWKANPNYRFQGVKIDAEGEKHNAIVTTNNLGFRFFGNIRSNRPKIFIIGDSYTHAIDVSDDQTYFYHLAEILNAEIFAYGAGGYGTLQEFMILEKYLDWIDPDIIILQYCSNDFTNNHFSLEKLSYGENNGRMRPYITPKGETIYAVPSSFPVLRNFINHYSLFMYFIVHRIDKLLAKYMHNKSIENIIPENPSLPLFLESVSITSILLNRIREKVPAKISIYAFASDDFEPFYSEFQKLSVINGIDLIDGIPQAVIKIEETGKSVRFDGSHWNENGHAIVAQTLGNYLKTKLNYYRLKPGGRTAIN